MISIIAAIGKNRQLGKRLTMNHHVIVGRKTFESIGSLPGRFPIVLTTQKNYKGNCLAASSLTEAITLAGGDNEIFIIGGGEVYAQALYLTDTIYLSEVDYTGEADTFFPDISMYSWFLKNIVEYEGWRFMELQKD
jgi:dihydrofolate reductase